MFGALTLIEKPTISIMMLVSQALNKQHDNGNRFNDGTAGKKMPVPEL